MVVFSSLTPHATRRNLTSDVRKAYIVQYCHAESTAWIPAADGSRGKGIPQDDTARQFTIVRDGKLLGP
jgi:hypothetical protein